MKKNISYIPTLLTEGNYYKTFTGKLTNHYQNLVWANAFDYGTLKDIEAIDTLLWPPVIKRFWKQELPQTLLQSDSIRRMNLRKLIKAGVNISAGTDAGNIGTLHASSFIQELQAMHEAGLSNAEILRCATYNPAVAFDRTSLLGTVEQGKQADLLLLTQNPLKSIDNLGAIELIFKKGKMMDPDTLIKESPEAIVQRQVNAYNAGNMNVFMNLYTDDVEAYEGETLVGKGREEVKQADFLRFDSDSYCHVENRIVLGNKVIDKVKVRTGNRIIHTIAIYEVVNGKIKKVTFIR